MLNKKESTPVLFRELKGKAIALICPLHRVPTAIIHISGSTYRLISLLAAPAMSRSPASAHDIDSKNHIPVLQQPRNQSWQEYFSTYSSP